MSILETKTLDMSVLLLKAYEIGDMINASAEVAEYLYWKDQVDRDSDIQNCVKLFKIKKQQFAECERFGHYHPDYHAALEEVKKVQSRLDEFEAVKKFKQAEERLDDLLYSVSKTIAHSVSETIKVPSNDPLPAGRGCGSGGGCSGKCG